MSRGRALWQSLRPSQWVKNLLVFAALVFGHQATAASAILREVFAFVLFCAAASGVYLINDIRDRAADALHPLKRTRPIASGALPLSWAQTAAVFLLTFAATASFALGRSFAITMIAFVLLQLLYTFGSKEVVILDVFSVAFGFVLRAVAGAFAIDVVISPWLLVAAARGARGRASRFAVELFAVLLGPNDQCSDRHDGDGICALHAFAGDGGEVRNAQSGGYASVCDLRGLSVSIFGPLETGRR
jgi:heme O synthase-like polyprenyltransferase